MTLKGGPCFLLLIVACAVLATPSDARGKNKLQYKNAVQKMIMKCREKDYAKPQKPLLETIFSENDMPIEGRDGDQAETLLSSFLDVLNPEGKKKAPAGRPTRPPMEDPKKPTSKALKCRHLSAMLKKMRNTTEETACYLRAFISPVAYKAWNENCKDEISPDEYDALLWGAEPLLEESPSARMNLPTQLDAQKMKPTLKTLLRVYDSMADSERSFVAKWAKDQITQNTFNCTMKASSDPSSRKKKLCKAPQKQLSLEVLTVMGAFMSHMSTEDISSSRKEKMCDFFRSGLLGIIKGATPTKCKWFLKRYRACFSEKEFLEHLDKLGPLTCCLSELPDLPPDVSRKVLSQLERCDGSMTKNLRKRLVKLYMLSNSKNAQALQNLGKNAKFLEAKQFLELNSDTLKEIVKNQRVQWTENQQCMLVKKQLGEKCDEMSNMELKDVQSLAKALPVCILKRLKVEKILKDSEVLKNISGTMRRGQLKAMLQKLPPDVLKNMMMPRRLACAVSLSSLKKANITSLELAENRTWCRSQAAYLAKMIKNEKQVNFRKLRSILGGFSCEMIEKAEDIKELAQAMAEAPQWLSKTQVRCAARKLFATLENKGKDYFKNITEEELNDIPTEFLLHLPPPDVRDLPDWVCPTFLEKLEKASLSLLPLRSWTRPALINRALRCMADESDLSVLTIPDISTLGPLICDFPPAKLALLAPDVLRATLQTMADCEHIPKRHLEALIWLVKQTFGDPSNWTPDIIELIGSILLLDIDSVSALPKKPLLKDTLYFLMSKRRQVSNALRKKWFELATEASSETTADSDSAESNGQKVPIKPTERLIEEVEMSTCYWSPSQLEAISKETFQNTVETLGTCSSYSAEQLEVLRRKAVEAFGSVKQMAGCQLMKLGCITQGFSEADLEMLPFSIDSLEEISKCAWTESQMKSVWRGVAQRNNLKAPDLGPAEMVALNRFICGLNSSEIQQLSKEAFKDAVGSMNGLNCAPKIMQRIKRVAVAAFGAPSSWDDSETNELSNIVPMLDGSELASLVSSAFSFIDETVIPRIPPGSLKALSEDQLKSFGPDNAEVVTSAQLGELSVAQRAALDAAATGSHSASQTPENSSQVSGEKSGAPSLDVEGVLALTKPFLFLCMGFLLL
ncbi:uncharacterized protein otoa [Salarias fasciatus]|uniref:Uncharacterized LOC115396631 n=1 Tax=Salarias fasciatus TaxID=181472 RepID=A0A672J2Z8_SALFA|nr:uncharacterized protein LOC115396631 [Salarias fasciatus]XP_029958452.1 uncharacterized protein LOC115396631 [Salarias fasciatus]